MLEQPEPRPRGAGRPNGGRGAETWATPRRKLLFLVTHTGGGGAQELWAGIAEGLAQRGHAVRLEAMYPAPDPRTTTATDIPWTHVAPAKPRSPLAAVSFIRSLVKQLRADPPDFIFTALPAANVLAPLAVKLAGVRSRVITSHHSPAATYNRLLDVVDSLTGSTRAVSTVLTVSASVGRSHHGKPEAYRAKLRTITNALPPHIEAEIARLKSRRDRSHIPGRLVVATGRLAYQKNYPTLIRAISHIADARLRIIGRGPDEEALKALADSLGVADRVEFTGFRPRTEALALMAAADVFAQPSLFEGHSLGLVEAARLGLPLVVSDTPEQIEGVTTPEGTACGKVVPVHDDRALAEALLSLLNDPDARADYAARAERLGDYARWDVMLDGYERLTD